MSFIRTSLAFAAAARLATAQAVDDPAAAAAPDAHEVRVLRTSNKAQTHRYYPRVYTFEHVNPYAVIRFMRRPLELEEGAWFAFQDGDRQGGKLLIVAPEHLIPSMDRLAELLDTPGLTSSAGSRSYWHEFRHRSVLDTDLINTLTLEGTPQARLLLDPINNELVVRDAPSGVDRITAAVRASDVPTPQLEAMVTVYEVDLTDDGRIGLDYVSWKNGPGRNLFAIGAFAQRDDVTDLTGDESSLLYDFGQDTHGLPGHAWDSGGLNYAYFYDVPSAYFDFLVSQSEARIVSETKLVALHASTAALEVSESILFYRVKHQPDGRAGARRAPLDPYGDLDPGFPDQRTVVPEVAPRELGEAKAGVFLQLTPDVQRTGARVDLFFSVVQHTGYGDDGAPVLASRTVDTVFFVPTDGRSITVGGLARTRRVDGAEKVPWLGDIPGLGSLFGGESRLDQKTLMFATIQARTTGGYPLD